MNPLLPCSIVLLLLPTAAMAQQAPAPRSVYDACSSYHSDSQPNESDVRAAAEIKAGQAALKASDFAKAEAEFRASISDSPDGPAYLGLADTLTAQGRVIEAIQTYRMLFHPGNHLSFGGSYFMQAQMKYALLLNRAGQWEEAVAVFEAALPSVPDRGMTNIGVHFDPDVPQPAGLAAAAHIALGLDANWHCNALGGFDHELAFQEYTKALQIAPDWATANYYHGYGWQRLDPKSRARIGSVRQAKSALQKALKSLDKPA